MRLSRALVLVVGVLLFAGATLANDVDTSTSSTSTATPGDVQFGIKDPVTCNSKNAEACYTITSTPFSFTMPTVKAGQSATIGFTNDTGGTLNSLELDLFTGINVTLKLFTCTPTAFFNTCLVTKITSPSPSTENEYQVLLENTNKNYWQYDDGEGCKNDGDNDKDDQCGGIPNGGVFFFTFTNPPCTNTGTNYNNWNGGTNGGQTCDTSLDWMGAGNTITVTTTPEPAPVALLLTGLVPLWWLRKRWLS